MSNGLLVRVAIDSTSGGWNGPCDDKDFCYVPMGSSRHLTKNYDSSYQPYRSAVEAFLPDSAHRCTHWPHQLPRLGHFDPDFEHLSYGDGARRGRRIRSNLAHGGFIVFCRFGLFIPVRLPTLLLASMPSTASCPGRACAEQIGTATPTRETAAARTRVSSLSLRDAVSPDGFATVSQLAVTGSALWRVR